MRARSISPCTTGVGALHLLARCRSASARRRAATTRTPRRAAARAGSRRSRRPAAADRRPRRRAGAVIVVGHEAPVIRSPPGEAPARSARVDRRRRALEQRARRGGLRETRSRRAATCAPASSMAIRSKPSANPPCGGAPAARPSSRKPNRRRISVSGDAEQPEDRRCSAGIGDADGAAAEFVPVVAPRRSAARGSAHGSVSS